MEHPFLHFLSKSCELILGNRIEKELQKPIEKNSSQKSFFLSFEQKFNINSQIPAEWTPHKYRALVIEFFLSHKTTKEKIMIEVWAFELCPTSNGKQKNVVQELEDINLRLSVLLRSISLLTVTLPLYKHFINDKTGYISKSYDIEYSMSFSHASRSSWYPNSHEEKNFTRHKSPELTFRDIDFSFRVLYTKSLEFLQGHRKLPSLDKKLRQYIHFMEKSTYDSKVNTSNEGYASPKGSHHMGSEGTSGNLSPIGSLFCPSPIETQTFPLKQTPGRKLWKNNNSIENKLERFESIDSDRSGDYDMYIYENEEFTEIMSAGEIDFLEGSPQKFALHPKGSEEEHILTEGSKEFQVYDLKLSKNTRHVEKLIEQNDDDKLADIIQAIDDLKDCSNSNIVNKIDEKELKVNTIQEGFKFSPFKGFDDTNNVKTLAYDYDQLRNFYSKLKGGVILI